MIENTRLNQKEWRTEEAAEQAKKKACLQAQQPLDTSKHDDNRSSLWIVAAEEWDELAFDLRLCANKSQPFGIEYPGNPGFATVSMNQTEDAVLFC